MLRDPRKYANVKKYKRRKKRKKKESVEFLAEEQKIGFSVCLFDGQANVKIFMFI